MGGWTLAIDFGTTSTVAAMLVGDDVELVPLGGDTGMLSLVFSRGDCQEQQRVLVGDQARVLAQSSPWCVERTPKRHLGEGFIQIGPESVPVVAAIGALLHHVAREAIQSRAGEAPVATLLTCPGWWTYEPRVELLEAARLAGLENVSLVSEAVAVANCFGTEHLAIGEHVAVYDLGGGTFDATVLRRNASRFDVVGVGGHADLGGEDFDERLGRFLGEQLDPSEWHMLMSSDEPLWQRAKYTFSEGVRAAKERLSVMSSTNVLVPSPVERELCVSRGDLERLITEDVERTVVELRRTIEGAGLPVDDLAAVYLAGGSTRIPRITQLIRQRLGVRPESQPDPTATIALGAAKMARDPSLWAGPVRREFIESIQSSDRESDAATAGVHAQRTGRSPSQNVLDDVQFSVFRPHVVQPARWYSLLAFAHKSEPFVDDDFGLVDPLAEVRRQAAVRLGNDLTGYGATSADSSQGLPRGSELTFVPEADGVEFNPPSRAFLWLEPVHLEEFRMRAEPRLDGGRGRGRLSVYFGCVLIAEVSLTFRVARSEQAVAVEHEHSRPYRKIFVSYSHHDASVVEQIETFLSVLGDEFLRDVHNLRTGETWESRLEDMIREADVFQLFWSTNSMTSPFVRQEWTYALGLGRPSFIRPVYWEKPLPELPEQDLPPGELRRLHFRYLPAVLAGYPSTKPETEVAVAQFKIGPSKHRERPGLDDLRDPIPMYGPLDPARGSNPMPPTRYGRRFSLRPRRRVGFWIALVVGVVFLIAAAEPNTRNRGSDLVVGLICLVVAVWLYLPNAAGWLLRRRSRAAARPDQPPRAPRRKE
jgi:actin-like ATPase involved in cell morphogenesis